jgi:AAA+ ATPase superfamily predicted ATPase
MMFRFWYRFVFPNMSGIVSGLGESIYDFEIAPKISAYMGFIFEEMCKQYVIEEAKRNALPFLMGPIGRWWGGNPKEKRQEEIDILTFRGDSALFCECKWTNDPVDTDVFQTLKERSELFSYDRKWLWLFSKSGFTARLIEKAQEMDNVRLIPYSDML